MKSLSALPSINVTKTALQFSSNFGSPSPSWLPSRQPWSRDKPAPPLTIGSNPKRPGSPKWVDPSQPF
ncbi:hypothetical protein V6N11_052509 [Hibiscus sabdariffa]|uniref:Uncharacterized protein n=1 Tax=Hibiscus sabdariffa TaxID=183260 RepID=A0ABR2UB03_9ROSI